MLDQALYTVHDAIVTPMTYNPKTGILSGGVYDRQGKLVLPAERSNLMTRIRIINPPTLDPQTIQTIVEEAIHEPSLYLGHYTHHYGHFLFETLARFWALDQKDRYSHFFFHTLFNSAKFPTDFQPTNISFDAFGIDHDKVTVIQKPMRIKTLFVPTKLIALNDQAHPEQADVYERIVSHVLQKFPSKRENLPKKIYLSRKNLVTNINQKRVAVNEVAIEEVFAQFGFEVVYPQTLDFAEQLHMFQTADVMAGIGGSALHNSVFMRPGTTTIALGIPREPNAPNLNQIICDNLASVRSMFVPFKGEITNDETGDFKIDPDHLTRWLDENLNTPNHKNKPGRFPLPWEEIKQNCHVVAIIGMHRSGTSTLAGSLQKSGLFAGEVSLSNRFQHKGNWENERFVLLNDSVLRANDSSWNHPPTKEIKWDKELAYARMRNIGEMTRQSAVWMFKDPRTLLTLPFWDEGVTNLHFVGIFRHPISVALSLYRREQMPIRKGIDLWIHYNQLLLEAWHRQNFPLICFDLDKDSFLSQLKQTIKELNNTLTGLMKLSADRAIEFYSGDGVNFRNFEPFVADGPDRKDDERRVELMSALYEALLVASNTQKPQLESAVPIPLSPSVEAFKQVVQLTPKSTLLHSMLGDAQRNVGDNAGAAENYQQALLLKPNQFEIQNKLGDAFIQTSQNDEAITVLEQAVGSKKATVELVIKLIQLYQKQKRYGKVVELAKTGFNMNPSYQRHHLTCLLANAKRQLGERKAAIDLYRGAIDLDPTVVYPYIALADSLRELEDLSSLEEGQAICKQAIKLEPENGNIYRALADIQRASKDHLSAVDNYKQALALGSNNIWVTINLSDSLNQLKRFAESRENLEQAISADTRHPAFYRLLGDSYRLDGDDQTAIPHYQKALTFNQTNVGILINLGWALIRQKEYERAAPYLRRAYKHQPNNFYLNQALNQLKSQNLFEAKTVSICAIIAVRNETHYLRYLLPHLTKQHIDVVLIDNESTDESQAFYKQFLGKPIIRAESIPRQEFFSLSDVLKLKQKLINEIDYDWVIHHDADEFLEHNEEGKTLRDAIQEADEAGYNVLNFEEFTFIPEPGENYFNKDYRNQLLQYYFYQPYTNRLNRAWKRSNRLINLETAGHTLKADDADIQRYPQSHILRHYIALSQEHVNQKYIGRTFNQRDVARGWHANRRNLTEDMLILPESGDCFFRLDSPDSKNFNRNSPTAKHYWEWEK